MTKRLLIARCVNCGCIIGSTESTLQCHMGDEPFLYHDFDHTETKKASCSSEGIETQEGKLRCALTQGHSGNCRAADGTEWQHFLIDHTKSEEAPSKESREEMTEETGEALTADEVRLRLAIELYAETGTPNGTTETAEQTREWKRTFWHTAMTVDQQKLWLDRADRVMLAIFG